MDTAKHLGYEFKKTTSKGKVVTINGSDCEFEILATFEFSSKRKRSTTIMRDEGVIKMMCKGADNVILERLSQK